MRWHEDSFFTRAFVRFNLKSAAGSFETLDDLVKRLLDERGAAVVVLKEVRLDASVEVRLEVSGIDTALDAMIVCFTRLVIVKAYGVSLIII